MTGICTAEIEQLRDTYREIHERVLDIGGRAGFDRELAELQRRELKIVEQLRSLGAGPYAPPERLNTLH